MAEGNRPQKEDSAGHGDAVFGDNRDKSIGLVFLTIPFIVTPENSGKTVDVAP